MTTLTDVKVVTDIQFFVPGIPRPGGSKRGFYNPKLGRVMIVKDGGQVEENWRQAVSFAAMKAMLDAPPMEGALCVSVRFRVPRPKGHFGKRGLLPSAPVWPTTKPDATKLWRGTEDALKGICWRDDSQIVWQKIGKEFGNIPGANIRIKLRGETLLFDMP